MKCPDCGNKIKTADFDPEYEWYECGRCEGCFTADEIEEAEHGTSPRARRNGGGDRDSVVARGLGRAARSVPVAKGKRRLTEIEEDEKALAEHEKAMLTPVARQSETYHRDEVATSQILNIVADEIENIITEAGGQIDRMNAREFYAMNLIRPLRVKHGISFRDHEVAAVYCEEHS
jgi:hypothetical protein